MGLDKIVASILADSKAKEQDILSEAEAEAKSIMDEAGQSKARVMESYRKKADESAARLRERQKAGLEIEVKKQYLSARKQVLDISFARTLEYFGNLPESDKKKLYSAMSARLLAEFNNGIIHCRKGEGHLFSELSGFTIDQSMDIIGGFLAESSDGTMVFDMRFEMLLNDIWDRHLNDVYALLFPEENNP